MVLKRIPGVAVLLVGLVSASVATAAATAKEKELSVDELRALQAKMRQTDVLTVDFVQTTFKALRGKSSKRDGKAMFSRSGKFKWMLETPVQEYKIYDGKDFYDYSPDANSAARITPDGPRAAQLHQIVDLVLNFDTLLSHYDLVKPATETAGTVTIDLKPKSASDVTEVELKLDTKESYISYLKFDLKNKNTQIHEFKNPSRKPLPENAFSLPKGVKITTSN